MDIAAWTPDVRDLEESRGACHRLTADYRMRRVLRMSADSRETGLMVVPEALRARRPAQERSRVRFQALLDSAARLLEGRGLL